ncbi:MAG: sensor histidine kinase [Microbacteriaceae bacterium]|nr:MAG: sensor histidine kinase [Microbacteriaceae bacterium]
MIRSPWWLLVLAAATVGPVVFLTILGSPVAEIATGAAVCAAYAAVFLLLRPRVEEGNRYALVLTVATIAWAATLTSLDGILAVTQTVAFPLAWVVASGRRWALVASLGVALAVGAGFLIGDGPDAIGTAIVSQTLSFGFSTIMGLWISRIAELGDEKARLLEELQATQSQLAAAERDAGVTHERARMSREVHDTVAQSLTGLVMLAQRARRDHANGTLDDELLELMETGARDALAETRALVASSAPVELSQGGIADALRLLGERFERETRIRVTVETAIGAPLDRATEVVLLRCAQEGLANVRKHSQATRAHLALTADADGTRLTVRDDGRGFPAEAQPGFGLAGLRDRLGLAGGTLEVDGTPGATTITATLPAGGAA